jgi:Flp pilus assembly protein TadD
VLDELIQDHHLMVARVYHLGRQRQWREAAEVLAQLSALDPPDETSRHDEAGLLSWLGDREGYRRDCRDAASPGEPKVQ